MEYFSWQRYIAVKFIFSVTVLHFSSVLVAVSFMTFLIDDSVTVLLFVIAAHFLNNIGAHPLSCWWICLFIDHLAWGVYVTWKYLLGGGSFNAFMSFLSLFLSLIVFSYSLLCFCFSLRVFHFLIFTIIFDNNYDRYYTCPHNN